jgi:hypothetical protein
MTINGSIGLLVLVVMLVFMLLALFSAITVPFAVWVAWTLIGIVLVAIGR